MRFSLGDFFLFDIDKANKLREYSEKVYKELGRYFDSKSYSCLVEEMVVDLICDLWSKEKKTKRPIYHEDKLVKVFRHDIEPSYRLYHILFVEILLPDSFVECSEQEAIKMIADTMISYFTETPLPLKIRKSFDKERFIADLRTFFDSYKGIDIGCDQRTK